MKPVVVPADAERVVVDYLTAILPSYGSDCTVSVGVPGGWTAEDGEHLQVALDGTPEVQYPVLWRATVRLTAWCPSTSDAKSLAALAQAICCAHPGSPEVGSIRALTGVLPATDPDSRAELASVTVRVNLTGTPA